MKWKKINEIESINVLGLIENSTKNWYILTEFYVLINIVR